jgi:hypothetical protein
MFDSSRNVLVFPSELAHIFDMQNDISPHPVKKLIAFSEDQAKAIASFRFSERCRSERAAIRRLIDLGLDVATAQPQQEAQR